MPRKIIIQDWAKEPFTATTDDLQPMTAHPRYGLPPDLRKLWGGRLLMSGSEMGGTFGGYLEGALEAAEATAEQIIGPGALRMTS